MNYYLQRSYFKYLFVLIFLISIFFNSCRGNNKKLNIYVREPVVAGMFYESNKRNLIESIKFYIKSATNIKISPREKIYGLIVPHAGYKYSGYVMGAAYKQVINKNYDTIILLGISHRYPLQNSSIYPEGYYKIPPGFIPIDKQIASEILHYNKYVSFVTNAHLQEHSIEVQLPFLKYVLKKDFRIVPILIGTDFSKLKYLVNTLYKVIKNHPEKNFLIIASSDLSHYPSYKDATKIDKETIKLISNFKINKLIKRELNIANSHINYLVTYQCGLPDIVLFLELMKKLNAKKNILLKYENSGDVTGLKDRVVGYMSMAFIGEKNMEKKFNLTEEEKKFLLKIARKTLNSYITTGKIPDFTINDEKLKEKCGAFVTLNKNHQLRGCIGYILPVKPLYQSVIENTINAAVHDPRFPEVTPEELKDIDIEISVLSPPEKVNSYKDIIIGKHGIILKKGFHSAVFLPQVAPEQGWDLATTLTHLSLKAGLGMNDWKEGAEFEVFTAIVFNESEYPELKDE